MHTLMNLCEIPVDIMHSTDHVTDTVFLWLHLPRASIPKSIYQVTSYKLAIFIESVCCDSAGVCVLCLLSGRCRLAGQMFGTVHYLHTLHHQGTLLFI